MRRAPGNWPPNSTISTPTVRRKSGKSCARWKSGSRVTPRCAMPTALSWTEKAGITATRIVERYNRPAVVISRDGAEAFGSGRSIRAFHLLEAIESCGGLFSRYGGHSHACGFAMPSANVADLRAQLDAFARTRLTSADFDPILDLDADLDLAEITPELFQALQLLEPYGMRNPEPVFAARGVQLAAPPRILKDKHVKLKIRAAALLNTLVPV